MSSSKTQSKFVSLMLAASMLAIVPGAFSAQKRAGVGAHSPAPSLATPSPTSVPDSETAQTPSTANATPKATLADFAWLEGHWQGTWGPRVAEQSWTSPKAGTMLGTFRLVEDEKTLVLELFTLVEKPEAINFYIRHFTPALVPWEKTDATFLKLVDFDATKVLFENPVDGEPKHSVITRVDADTFVSRSEIIPEGGDLQVIEITYHRQKPVVAVPPPSGGNGARQ
jgi:Domain of unknown function (DUF6265)